MFLVDDVWSQDDFAWEPFFALAQACQQLLVGRPGASRHQDGAVVALQEALHHCVGFGSEGYLVHTVVACVAGQ